MKQVNLILAVILLCMAGCTESGVTFTPSATAPAALLPASTATLSPSPTPEPATATSQPEPSATPTVTATIPPPPTSPPTPTTTTPPLPTATPVATVAPAANPTLATTPTPALGAECTVPPAGSFLTIWQNQPGIRAKLGCPTDVHPRITPQAWPVQTSYQPFEQGAMLWSDHIAWYDQPVIYVIYADRSYERFEDKFDPAIDSTGGETVEGRVEPALGFGKVWREQPGVRERLGWPTAPEEAGEGYFQMFGGGEMIWLSQAGRTYIFIRDGLIVDTFEGPFSLK